MKKVLFLSALLFASMSVFAQSGEQLPNPGFEGNWDKIEISKTIFSTTYGYEPQHWNGFPTANASSVYSTAKNGDQLAESSDVRPGSTGSKSAKVIAKSILGVVANGNLTNGRINGASTDAGDADNNYNYMDPSESDDYKCPFTSRPDSIVVWVKFSASSSSSKANISCFLIGNERYQTPTDSYKGKEIAKAYMDFSVCSSWTRIAIPFVYNNTNTPAFCFFTATTNTTPGAGSAGDYVLLDDIEMIYNPEPGPGPEPEPTEYAITCTTPANGSLSANATSAVAGTVITLTATPEAGYELEALSATDAAGNAVTITNNTFAMPESNVTVSATFKQQEPGPGPEPEPTGYTVTVKASENGSVTSSLTSAEEGERITLTVTPANDCKLRQILVTKASGSKIPTTKYSQTEYRFDMPAENVVVTALFGSLTDVDEVEDTVVSCEKVLINGHLYILKNNKCYTLNGMLVR